MNIATRYRREVVTRAATAWIADDSEENYRVQGEDCRVEVERSDEDEVRLGIHLHGAESEDVGLYLTKESARDVALALIEAGV